MKHTRFILMTLTAIIAAGLNSCSKMQFNKEDYEQILQRNSPVDSVDANHRWALTSSRAYNVLANAGEGTMKLQILTDNPRQSGDAHVLTQTDIEAGQMATISLSYPTLLTKLYAALVDASGAYTLTSFTPTSASTVNFSSPIFSGERLSYTPQPQEYAFCYEGEYPEPGDYDYNEVVLHISMERASERVMLFHVTLAAVGATEQLSACLRLPDYAYDEVESVETEGGDSFNAGLTEQQMTVFKQTGNLLEGLSGEAIINLFADAHWATGDPMTPDYGQIQRKLYNVTNSTSTTAQKMVPRTITYIVTFKDGSKLNSLTLDHLDPFVIKFYSNGRQEIHTYDYRRVTALYEFTFIDIQNLPWALKVPMGDFAHPLDGVNIGFKKKEIYFGAYSTSGHAFGEWAYNRRTALDWYLYPTENQVFQW